MTTRRAPLFLAPARVGEAKSITLPGIGTVVTISLMDLPLYLESHQLEPMTRGEIRDLLDRTGQPRRQVLYVRRVQS